MKNIDLINLLSKHPSDYEVVINNWSNKTNDCFIFDMEHIKVSNKMKEIELGNVTDDEIIGVVE